MGSVAGAVEEIQANISTTERQIQEQTSNMTETSEVGAGKLNELISGYQV